MTSIKFRALTHSDHKLFFEALGEHGKDFQNIQQYMTQKGNKNKSEQNSYNKSIDQQEKKDHDKKDEDKKREQIRNFYNKLYTRLSQLVGKLDDRVEKVNQELYLLINYGEIWKKRGFIFNDKAKKLLEDLLKHGSTTLRFKNKNVRLRTPLCRALKKINQIGIDEKVKVVTTRELPKDVIVEFHPSTNADWLKVQSISQNPRVRAKLSIQKRLTNILDFLENKWNVSQDKLNRTIDTWLKSDSRGQQSIGNSDLTTHRHANHPINIPNGSILTNRIDSSSSNQSNSCNNIDREAQANTGINQRLRLKPSAHHELKEVNITRVVPDNHLDLSLTAYINRLTDNLKPSSSSVPDSHSQQRSNFGHPIEVNHLDVCNPRLPVSLTTPDCSILFERSCTSDQPSIAQARKHLDLLQSLTGALDGCENSRTACEDTQDKSLQSLKNQISNQSDHGPTGLSKSVGFASHNSGNHTTVASAPIIMINNDIPALYDEDASLPVADQPVNAITKIHSTLEAGSLSRHSNFDSQNSKSIEFSLPKNLTLGEFFNMKSEQMGGDCVINPDETANDAFPTSFVDSDAQKAHQVPKNHSDGNQHDGLKDSIGGTQNHLVDIKRLAEGWTRIDDAIMTIGELYLALKCPKKIILEYSFERFKYVQDEAPQQNSSDSKDSPARKFVQIVHDPTSDDKLMMKLLTAANLTLAQIERHKQDEQMKLLDQQQSCAKLKRRKCGAGGPGPNTMTLHDIETNNQRVEEALKQLQPTRLCNYRRAR